MLIAFQSKKTSLKASVAITSIQSFSISPKRRA